MAKYGDKSVYFDLEDLGNTTGEWDVYGSDAPSPYNPLQVRVTICRKFSKIRNIVRKLLHFLVDFPQLTKILYEHVLLGCIVHYGMISCFIMMHILIHLIAE